MKYQFIKDGTSQDDRVARALEEGFFNIDDLALEELLSMAVDYSKILKYYNLSNEQDGDWEHFFTYDDTVILAMILTVDLNKVETRFFGFLKKVVTGSYNVGRAL